MSVYSDLLRVIKIRVCQNNGISETSLSVRNNYKACQAWNRISQIFTLECVLNEHRKKFGSVYEPLANEKALHHMVFQITHWKLSEIKALSFNELVFIISDKLRSEYLPSEARQFLESASLPYESAYPLDEFSAEDWVPTENSAFL